jgi:hypothetical protein
MNTKLSLPRVAFMALALGTAGVTATFAQTTNASTTTPPCTAAPGGFGGGWHHHHDSVLNAAERTELKNAKEQALASNGTLQTQEASLKQQFETLKGQGSSATHDQWKALHQQAFAFHQQLKSAELLVDPNLAPIFAKLDAAHQHGHHHFNGSASTPTSST